MAGVMNLAGTSPFGHGHQHAAVFTIISIHIVGMYGLVLFVGELAAGDLRVSTPHRLGAAAGRRRDRLRPLDRVEGAVEQPALSRPPKRLKEPANSSEGRAPVTCCTWTRAGTRAS